MQKRPHKMVAYFAHMGTFTYRLNTFLNDVVGYEAISKVSIALAGSAFLCARSQDDIKRAYKKLAVQTIGHLHNARTVEHLTQSSLLRFGSKLHCEMILSPD